MALSWALLRLAQAGCSVVSSIKNGNELVHGWCEDWHSMLALTAALSRGSALKSDEFKSAIYVCQTWQLMSVKFRGEKSSSSKRYEVYSSKLYTTTMIFFLDIITNNISYNHRQIVLMMCRKTKYTIQDWMSFKAILNYHIFLSIRRKTIKLNSFLLYE